MENQSEKLNQQQCTALREFIEDGDRGRTGIFVGRKAELDHVRACVRRLLRRQADWAPGADLTTVIQGAPGAGKSALLEKVAEEWPFGGQGPAVALDPGVLTLPMPDFLGAIVARVTRVPGFVRMLRQYIGSIAVNVAGLAKVEVGVESSKADGKSPVPVILLFDEIQTILTGSTSAPSREHLTNNLRLLHTGQHGAPMFPVYGGLANSADLLRAAGLTRLASGSEWTLAGFSEAEVDELMARFVKEHLSSAEPTPATLDRWREALRRDSQGWPMHARNFLIALCEEIRAKDYRPAAVDLDMVRLQAQRLRCAYYEQRMQGSLRNKYVLISKVLEEIDQEQSMPEDRIIDAITKAHQDCLPEDVGRGGLPEGTTASQAFATLLHAGIVQKVDEFDYACPIPSLSSHVAARAIHPPSRLHEAVLKARPEAIDSSLERCREDGERAQRLQATDRRGRTPLILAAELSLMPLVEQLVAVESRLPIALRSVELRDNEGRTARDHAAASGDERLVARLDRVQSPAAGHAR